MELHQNRLSFQDFMVVAGMRLGPKLICYSRLVSPPLAAFLSTISLKKRHPPLFFSPPHSSLSKPKSDSLDIVGGERKHFPDDIQLSVCLGSSGSHSFYLSHLVMGRGCGQSLFALYFFLLPCQECLTISAHHLRRQVQFTHTHHLLGVWCIQLTHFI